ncbi:MAG: polysaccharide deacetylase family protein [Chitinophagaceae bacterium]|nr:polysaccharide deacetylase family protein [Chitinophagaceae bacterium]
MYLVKTPWWLRALYPSLVWSIKTESKELYLTFDDGPHPSATPFVLDALDHYNAKATFFCIGKNVLEHSGIFHRVIAEGHRTGNHTHNHLNGWQTDDNAYSNNIHHAAGHINSNLFRPPYGRIKRSQVKDLNKDYKIIMWDVLSGDFDSGLQAQKSLGYVTRFSRPGSIIVFHDSAKAFKTLQFVLPKVLDHFSRQGYVFKTIP